MKKRIDKNEFLGLLEQNKRIIHKVALIYTNNTADKEDLYQEICLALWRSYKDYEGRSLFSTWLYRVAINTAISQVRKNKNNILSGEVYPETSYEPNPLADNEPYQLLFRAIARLNRIDKAIILLWLEEKKYDEIAQIMGISKTNVSVKLVRIKQSLANIMKGQTV